MDCSPELSGRSRKAEWESSVAVNLDGSRRRRARSPGTRAVVGVVRR
jgi:hypothetical protein